MSSKGGDGEGGEGVDSDVLLVVDGEGGSDKLLVVGGEGVGGDKLPVADDKGGGGELLGDFVLDPSFTCSLLGVHN